LTGKRFFIAWKILHPWRAIMYLSKLIFGILLGLAGQGLFIMAVKIKFYGILQEHI